MSASVLFIFVMMLFPRRKAGPSPIRLCAIPSSKLLLAVPQVLDL